MPAGSNTHKLTNERCIAATRAFEAFDFGDNVIKDVNGWEFAESSVERTAAEWTRVAYLESEDDDSGADGDGSSERVVFVVRFAPGTAVVEESYVSGW